MEASLVPMLAYIGRNQCSLSIANRFRLIPHTCSEMFYNTLMNKLTKVNKMRMSTIRQWIRALLIWKIRVLCCRIGLHEYILVNLKELSLINVL
jgi:hypothetical protein